MSVLDGPGEGTWSVFAVKVCEERDQLREALVTAKDRAALAEEYVSGLLRREADLHAELKAAGGRIETLEREHGEVYRLVCAALSWHDAPSVETAETLHRACECHASGCPLDQRTAERERDSAIRRRESAEQELAAMRQELAAMRRVVQTTAIISPKGLASAISALMARGDVAAPRATQAALGALWKLLPLGEKP